MKKLLLVIFVFSFVLVSCTDNTEIIEKDGTTELAPINKEDDIHKGGEDEEEEPNNDL
ncbi:hypothetical protein [Tenacibaculum aiptasiae]|uniref:hypothetical protein n=1 Tax=Tenacibaculum aiptasiae TaxID=426481 RepID=UPI00232C1318|nr:hypothetical protein [Tenacibaculum aiptasiae]